VEDPQDRRSRTSSARLEAICAEYESARVDEAVAQGRKRAAKAAILSLIRDAETVYCEGFKILAAERPGGEVSYHRRAYRDFRVFARGSREE